MSNSLLGPRAVLICRLSWMIKKLLCSGQTWQCTVGHELCDASAFSPAYIVKCNQIRWSGKNRTTLHQLRHEQMFVLFSEEQADCCSARAPVCLNQNNQNECLLEHFRNNDSKQPKVKIFQLSDNRHWLPLCTTGLVTTLRGTVIMVLPMTGHNINKDRFICNRASVSSWSHGPGLVYIYYLKS